MTTKKKALPNYEVPALDKGLDIIETLAHSAIPLSQIEIARRLEKTVSQVFRMITCLEKRGYIFKDPEANVYSLTLKMYQLVNQHPPVEKLLRTATAPMMDLSNNIAESCHLSVLSGSQVVILNQIDSPKRVSVHIRSGATMSILESNSGRVLIAYKEESEQQALLELDEGYRTLTKKAKTEFIESIKKIKEDGHFYSQSYTVDGIVDIVAPIITNTGEAIAALAVPCIKYRNVEIPVDNIIKKMKTAASTIAKQSGLINN